MRHFSPAQLAAQERFKRMVKSGAWPKRNRRPLGEALAARKAAKAKRWAEYWARKRANPTLMVMNPGGTWSLRAMPDGGFGILRHGRVVGELHIHASGYADWSFGQGPLPSKSVQQRLLNEARGRRANPTLMVMNPGRKRPNNGSPMRAYERATAAMSRHGQAHGVTGRRYAALKARALRAAERLDYSRVNPSVPSSAVRMYRKFHGSDPMNVRPIQAPPGTPKHLVMLGKLTELGYRVPGHSGKAGRKNIPYLHKSGSGNILATDATGRNLFILKDRGSRMRVKSDGIND